MLRAGPLNQRGDMELLNPSSVVMESERPSFFDQ